VADCRRLAITNQAKAVSHDMREARTSPAGFRSNAGRNNRNSHGGKPTIKNCDFYNQAVCSHRGDHRNGTVFWRHVCRVCSAPDHIEKDCGFLSGVI
jgi:hypothetical protein